MNKRAAASRLKPFVAPPFDAGQETATGIMYYWWSWNPNYPFWSKSCWGGKTKSEASKAIKKGLARSMRLYHNKLIREGDGQFTEVADMPFDPRKV